jgi:membrane-associated phospholipid phosphatase
VDGAAAAAHNEASMPSVPIEVRACAAVWARGAGGARRRGAGVAARAVLTAVVALAAAPARPSVAVADELAYDVPVDAAVTAAAVAAWVGPELLKDRLAPLQCRWCQADGVDLRVRSALRWSDRGGAAVTASNVSAYVVAPVTVLGLAMLGAARAGGARGALVDLLVIAEAVALAGDLDQLTKFTVGRQRPYAHAGLPNPDRAQGPADANLSFYSGHTSFTFSLAAAAGTVARWRGYRWYPALYAIGGTIAAATAYLRMAGDQHYLTDVLVGAAAGTAVGVGVPTWLHRPRGGARDGGGAGPTIAVTPFAGGGGLSCALAW